MNFFEHQQQARRRSARMVLLFLVVVLLIIAATDLAVAVLVMLVSHNQYDPYPPLLDWLRAHPRLLWGTSLVVAAGIGIACLYRLATLRHGGGAVAQQLGGVRVESGTHDPARRQLLNVVEETAIAAGLAVPEVYVLEHEAGMNAFAAGFTPNDAAIAVTRGLLENLTRDELQGVVAHEFSHILHGDMTLNTRLIGLSFGILLIALTGRMILRALGESRSSSSDGRAIAGVYVFGLVLFVLGYLGVVATRLLKAAVARDRERLADASAVQFTRNASGIAGALKKIAISPLRQTLVAAEGEEISHMLIAEHTGMFTRLFATHPPILERIKLLEPRFNAEELKNIRLTPMQPMVEVVKPDPPALPEVLGLAPHVVVALVGTPGRPALDTAAALEQALAPALQLAARSSTGAVELVLALVLATDNAIRATQLQHLTHRQPGMERGHVENLAQQIRRLDTRQRLPLLDLAFPALRRRPALELRALIGLVDELVKLNGPIRLFDYVLSRLLRQMLGETLTPARHPLRPAFKLRHLQTELQTLFALLAQAGHADAETARAACAAGLRRLLPHETPAYAPPRPWVEPLDLALLQLDRLPPLVKQELVAALAHTVLHDKQVTLAETELLRVICAQLHCPLPPLAA